MQHDPPDRRAFLSGRAALGELQARAAAAIPPPQRAACVVNYARTAMACRFEVRLLASHEQNDAEAAVAALDLIDSIEGRISVYREDTELQQLNRLAYPGPAAVAEDLFALFQFAGAVHAGAEGAYDITGGPLSKVWGFYERRGRVPSGADLEAARARSGWRHVKLDPVERTVSFDTEGVELNLNSMGKGFALDRAASLLEERGVEDFLIHGGSSTLVARGANRAEGLAGWQVGVRDPLRPSIRIAEFELCGAAMSTSGAATQHFVDSGRRFGHLIDPRTGAPAEGVHSVSVVAPTGVEAEALSTAFYVAGPAVASRFCEGRPDLGVIFVLPSTGGGVRIETLGTLKQPSGEGN